MTIRLCFVLLVAVLAAANAGCESSDSCAVICAKNAACQHDGPGEERCKDLCREQSEDDAYAEAIEHQAECYGEGWSCGDLAGGVCATPD